jgi:hypothetical protein
MICRATITKMTMMETPAREREPQGRRTMLMMTMPCRGEWRGVGVPFAMAAAAGFVR